MTAERKLAKPGFGMAVVLSLLVVGIQTWMSVPLTLLDEVLAQGFQLPRAGLAQNPLIAAFINLLAIGGPIALGLFLNRLQFSKAFPLARVSMSQAAAMALSILGADVLLSEADNLFRAILPAPQFLIEAYKQVFTSEGNLVERIFLLVIVAPVTEELLFRGIILRGLLSRHRPAVAVGLSSLLFALVHLNPWQFISAFWLGVVFGWFYLRTGSINICILGHAISNGLFVFFTTVPTDIPGLTTPPAAGHVQFQPLWLDATGALMLVAGVACFSLATHGREAVPEESGKIKCTPES
jgi:uncharacterized protein